MHSAYGKLFNALLEQAETHAVDHKQGSYHIEIRGNEIQIDKASLYGYAPAAPFNAQGIQPLPPNPIAGMIPVPQTCCGTPSTVLASLGQAVSSFNYGTVLRLTTVVHMLMGLLVVLSNNVVVYVKPLQAPGPLHVLTTNPTRTLSDGSA
ncbi:hypothetical protein B9Z19DRAFT_1111698 [Tuber borchii]|uniref:Uncharacterized protein n=1 Tax=Tuber borchii TaxID=42251 RepID=A0A2T6ZAR6_TUBBO|nr:hypothetical protein B9Z19DRAFT_1111698 [Tuber borchii]